MIVIFVVMEVVLILCIVLYILIGTSDTMVVVVIVVVVVLVLDVVLCILLESSDTMIVVVVIGGGGIEYVYFTICYDTMMLVVVSV